MFTQDYLMRMILELVGAIRKSILMNDDEDDPLAAAQLLEAALDGATEMDSSLLLSLEPRSLSAMLKMSAADPSLMTYVSRMLLLESRYLEAAQSHSTARLRHDQAFAVAEAFGVPLSESDVEPSRLETFLEGDSVR